MILCKHWKHKGSRVIHLGIVPDERVEVKNGPYHHCSRHSIDPPSDASAPQRTPMLLLEPLHQHDLMSSGLYLRYFSTSLFRNSDITVITEWHCGALRDLCSSSCRRHASFFTRLSSCHMTTPVFIQRALSRSCCCLCAGRW